MAAGRLAVSFAPYRDAVDHFDNPAGRLHALLARYDDHPANTTRLQCWADALDVASADVPIHIGRVHLLIRDTEEAAKDAPRAWSPVPEHLVQIRQSIFGNGLTWKHGIQDARVPGEAMQALDMFSMWLHDNRPDGAIPTHEERSQLREQVESLMSAVLDEELPADVRRAFVLRINDMLDALDHLEEGGPESVRRAAEALMVAAFAPSASSSLRSKVANVGTAIVLAVTILGQTADTFNSLATAAQTAGLLEAGDEPKLLNPGPDAEATAGDGSR